MLFQYMELAAALGKLQGSLITDILNRLRTLMMSSARLVEDQLQPENEISSQGSFKSRSSLRSAAPVECDVACRWDVSQNLTVQNMVIS